MYFTSSFGAKVQFIAKSLVKSVDERYSSTSSVFCLKSQIVIGSNDSEYMILERKAKGFASSNKSSTDLAAMGLDGYEGAAAPTTATGLGAGAMDDHYSRSSSSMAASTSIPINSSNIGFQLLKKHGWKEGSGLGIAEQGRLEPVEGCVKRNKRGLGADKGKKASEHTKSEKAGKEVKLPVKKKTKAVSKKMKKILEFEKQLQEKELVREFYREFWPDNV